MKFLTVVVLVVVGCCLSLGSAYIPDHEIAESQVSQSGEFNENKPNMNGRIINGLVAPPNEFPFQGLLNYKKPCVWGNNDTYMICGGSLIDRYWFLTAGHCIHGNVLLYVILGTTTPNDVNSPGRVTPELARAFYSGGFEPSTLANDIGLIKFKNPVEYTPSIQPVALARSTDYVIGSIDVWASGWGATSDTQRESQDTLLYVHLYTISNAECIKTYGTRYVRDYNICTEGILGRNICMGDSGGPLVTKINGIYTQVGITSFIGIRGCELSLPAGYLRISNAIPWINNVTGLAFE